MVCGVNVMVHVVLKEVTEPSRPGNTPCYYWGPKYQDCFEDSTMTRALISRDLIGSSEASAGGLFNLVLDTLLYFLRILEGFNLVGTDLGQQTRRDS